MVYYGVSFGSVDLGWNIYLTFALTSLVEIPSNLAAIYYGGRFVIRACTDLYVYPWYIYNRAVLNVLPGNVKPWTMPNDFTLPAK